MDYTSIFQYMADRHIEGHDIIMARNFKFPLPIFIKDRVSLIKTQEQFCKVLAEFRATLELAGAVQVEVKQVYAQHQKGNGVSISIVQTFFSPQEQRVCTLHLTYFGRVVNDKPTFHMVECTDFTSLAEDFPVLGFQTA